MNLIDEPLALVSPHEAAYLLQKHVSTIYIMLNAGDIPGKKIAGRWVIPRKWLEKLEEIDNYR